MSTFESDSQDEERVSVIPGERSETRDPETPAALDPGSRGATYRLAGMTGKARRSPGMTRENAAARNRSHHFRTKTDAA
jgi:hypothetical protein